MKVTAEQFVRIWQTGKSVTEIAKKIGNPKQSISQRAVFLRSKGVLLKKFYGPGGCSLDYKALAKLAKSLNGGK